MMEQRAVCLADSIGDVLLYDIVGQSVEVLGSFPSGIACMSWSPDQEIVVIVSDDNKLILMTSSFDPLTEVDLNPQEEGEVDIVSVGWGSKKTQFHGSEGKEAAKAAYKVSMVTF